MKVGIITAASEKYAKSLFSLLGSLNCNWPTHPPVTVFDLGLSDQTIQLLKNSGIVIRQIPAFCEHWRAHYTWKVWCMNHADTDVVIWMDAGMCILEPLDEVLDIIKERGYFVVPNYQFLDYEASESACLACDVPFKFRIGKGSIAGTFIGFLKRGEFGELIDEAYQVALKEDAIKAYNSKHKHDQSIISLLVYKRFPNPQLEDGIVYLGWKSPRMIKGQRVWLQRRQILNSDVKFFRQHLIEKGVRYVPKDPTQDIPLVQRLYRSTLIKAKTAGKKLLKKNSANGIR